MKRILISGSKLKDLGLSKSLKKETFLINFFLKTKKTYLKFYLFLIYKKKKFLHKKKNYNFINFPSVKNGLFDKINLIQIASKEIGNKKILPFGIFSHAEKITDVWNLNNRWKWLAEENELIWGDIEISSDHLNVVYRAFGGSDEDSAAIRGNIEILNNNPINYFEVKILNTGREGFIGIGLAHYYCDLDRLPGWEMYSFGYHGDDGHLFDCSGTGKKYGPKFWKGDVIGICWNFMEKTIFFTKNGTGLSIAFHQYSWFDLPSLAPIIGLRSEGESIQANFGKKFFEFDIEAYFIQFTIHHMFRINFLGKIISLQKVIKGKNDDTFTKPLKSFSNKKFKKILVNNIFKKKGTTNQNTSFFFFWRKKLSLSSENLDSLILSAYLKFLVKITTLTDFVESFKEKSLTSEIYDQGVNFSVSLLNLIRYIFNFSIKSNYIKNFRIYLNSLFTKEKNSGEFFQRYLHNTKDVQSVMIISNIYQSFTIFFERRLLIMKKSKLHGEN